MPPGVRAPLFVVGCPRSGTGLLHQVLRLHADLAWVTPVSNWICGKSWFRTVPPTAAGSLERGLDRLPRALVPPFLRGPYDGSLNVPGLPETREGHSIWNRFCRSDPDHAMTESDATASIRAEVSDVVTWHLKRHDRPRFVNKMPRHALRLRFLHALFPQARFLHVVRDGRAVAASILKRRRSDYGTTDRWWGARPPGWREHLSEPPIRQAAWMWRTILHAVEQDADALPADALHTVTYERFTREPGETLRAIFTWADLPPERFFDTGATDHLSKIRPARDTWTDRLTSGQQAELARLQPTLERYGYDPAMP